MADKQSPDDGPSLELPSLGSLFRRNKKPAKPSRTAAASTPSPDAQPSAADFDRLVKGETTPPGEPAGAPGAGDESTIEDTRRAPIDPAPVDAAEVAEPARAVAPPEVARTVETPALDPSTASTDSGAAELPEHDLIDPGAEPDLEDLVDDRAAVPVAATAAIASTRTVAGPSDAVPTTVSALDDDATETPVDDEAPAVRPARSLSDLKFSLPAVDGRVAAAITGLIVGLLAVGLTAGGMEGCEAVRGTSSCGGSGIGILVLIMAVLVLVGSALLAAWKVTDPTSTSFLAVGLLAVIAMLFLIEVIFERSMIVVIPLVSVATYLLSHFVTTRFIDEE